MKILSRPSRSACCLTRPEPGTTIAWRTLDATRLPRATAAAARRSSMRELVHEPMNTRSTRMSVKGVLGFKPIYCKARSMPLRRTSSFSRSGSGTRESTGSTISGDVPQVTCGLMSRALTSTTVSNLAPSSVCSVRQYLTA
ncbi:hypothetical protein D3C72_1441150 [compost metagenome]